MIYLDSYKLVRFNTILLIILIGVVIALLAYITNSYLLRNYLEDQILYARYISPIIEETLKSSAIIMLVRSQRVGFMVDGAIYGFAIGSGFAFIENITYLIFIENYSLLIAGIRGFGTAFMHGCTTAIFATISMNLHSRGYNHSILHFLPGLVLAIIIHSGFNHFIISPVIMTISQILIIPLIFIGIFYQSEIGLKKWLNLNMDTEMALLDCVNSGSISKSKVGSYFQIMKETIPGKVMVDIICYLRIYLELAINAKGKLLLQEAGFKQGSDKELKAKITEMKFLQKSIGKTGQLALSPVIRFSNRDLWQLYFINDG
ncbi:MAG: PrsW family glutamic-type intramembrane protease [Candidatus Neomarinimicrobiota bacterium]